MADDDRPLQIQLLHDRCGVVDQPGEAISRRDRRRPPEPPLIERDDTKTLGPQPVGEQREDVKVGAVAVEQQHGTTGTRLGDEQGATIGHDHIANGHGREREVPFGVRIRSHPKRGEHPPLVADGDGHDTGTERQAEDPSPAPNSVRGRPPPRPDNAHAPCLPGRTRRGTGQYPAARPSGVLNGAFGVGGLVRLQASSAEPSEAA